MINSSNVLKIALIDLNHMTLGVHTNTVPLGIGMIARYLTIQQNYPFDIKLFKDPNKFLETLKNWHPDILGMAQYVWNTELNHHMAQIVKKKNPNCFVICGGPNLFLSKQKRHQYLKENDFIDVCVAYDGEIPFENIVKRYVSGETISDIRCKPTPGTYAIDPASNKLCESFQDIPRIASLEVFGAIYADGLFDEFLNDGYHPFLQTQRGCPFQCAYCHTGGKFYSKISFQSAENFKTEMEYLSQRYAGQHNVKLNLANTNFGLYDEDFKIAQVIKEVQDKYDWPKSIEVNSSNRPEKVLSLLSMLKYKFQPALALQTLTPKVLKNIKRKNIPFEKFVEFQNKVIEGISENTATELILGLPEESKESFMKSLSQVLNSGVQNVVIYTLMSLRGTAISTQEVSERYGHVIRYRIVPRCFSKIDGTNIFEPEEVVVASKTMPFEDYLDLRELCLVITAFASSVEMFPLRKFLLDNGINSSDWIFGIHEKIVHFPKLKNIYESFLKETQDELFPSKEACIQFYSQKKNFELLKKGKYGDNLLRKYKTILLSSHYKQCIDLAVEELLNVVQNHKELHTPKEFIHDLHTFVKSRDVGQVFKKGYYPETIKKVRLSNDIPLWLKHGSKNVPFNDFKGSFVYSVAATDHMKNRLKSFGGLNRDPLLSLQILIRDGEISSFWPKWKQIK